VLDRFSAGYLRRFGNRCNRKLPLSHSKAEERTFLLIMLSRPLSPGYAKRCTVALQNFAQPGDAVVALCPIYDPTATCGLCQRPAIYRCFPVQNLRTDAVLTLGVECVQVYHLLVKKLRRTKAQYRDPGTIAAIVKRYQRRGQLTEEQALDFLTAAHAVRNNEKPPGRLRVLRKRFS